MIDSEQLVTIHLTVAWASICFGALTGALIGLFFRRPNWLGGYAALPRRLVRLGHIAGFGLGILNVCYAVTVAHVPLNVGEGASPALIAGTIMMPAVCFLSAWREKFHYLFALPVIAISYTALATFIALARVVT